MKRTAIFVATGLVLLASTASAYNKHRHHAHTKHLQTKHYVGHRAAPAKRYANHHLRRTAKYGTSPLGCLPAELRTKVVELVEVCGSHIIRTYTPGAVIFGTNYPSEHAHCRAADLDGNPGCIYAHLRGFRGGYSTDYARMAHVHISWHPGGIEQGARFVHGGGYARTTSSILFAGR